MFTDPLQPPYFVRWNHSRAAKNDGLEFRAGHRLAELACFNDVGLAQLIDQHPRSEIKVSGCGHQPLHPSEHRVGQLGNQDGQTLIRMLRHGRFRLTLRNVVRHHPELGRIVSRCGSEINECEPQASMLGYDGDLVLESPGMIQYLEAAALPQTTWQIRGQSTLHHYDVSALDCLTESIARQWMNPLHRVRRLYLEPAMESAATVEFLHGGDVVSTGQFVPHRITGGAGINVRLSIRHCDSASWSRLQAMIGNHVLNQYLPCKLSTHPHGVAQSRGPMAWLKRKIGSVIVGSPTPNAFGKDDPDAEVSFALVAEKPDGLERFDHSKIPPSTAMSPPPAIIPPVSVPVSTSSMSMTYR